MRLRYWHLLILALSIAAAPFTFADDASAQPEGIKADIEKAEIKVEKDLKKALDAAKADGKKVMLEFSGSDWCPPCKMLHRFIIKTKEFADYANEKLHVYVADFDKFGEPKDKANSEEIAELIETYQIRGFPTIVILNSDGEVIDFMEGLQVRSADELIERIENAKPSAAEKKCEQRPRSKMAACPASDKKDCPKKASCAAASQSAAPVVSDSNACQKADSTKDCSAKGNSACSKPQGQNASVGAAAQK